MEEASALHTQLRMRYLFSALRLSSPEGLCISHQLPVAQSSVSVGVVPWEWVQPMPMARERVGEGCSGEQCGRCLGDQILSQEAGGLARQSPGAQNWVPGRVWEVDGAGSGVGQQGYAPTKASPQRGALEKIWPVIT